MAGGCLPCTITPILAFPLRGKGQDATPILAFRRVPCRHSGLEPGPMPVAFWFIHEWARMGHEWVFSFLGITEGSSRWELMMSPSPGMVTPPNVTECPEDAWGKVTGIGLSERVAGCQGLLGTSFFNPRMGTNFH